MQRFRLGQLVGTSAALALLNEAGITPAALLARHAVGDWGDLPPEDARENADALLYGGRLFSAYEVPGGRVWVITKADRSATTILLPDDY